MNANSFVYVCKQRPLSEKKRDGVDGKVAQDMDGNGRE